ncbi:hypothetical protein C0J45_7524 [Silurus meridionalis]|nr:hypothetical protein C0J45_7524 [Silurus meridionalis]
MQLGFEWNKMSEEQKKPYYTWRLKWEHEQLFPDWVYKPLPKKGRRKDSLQTSDSQRRPDHQPNHHIVMNMPEEVPVHDLVSEVIKLFPGLSHQELLSPKDFCFDPPLFPSVSESTFCQTNTCYGSDCTSSEVQLKDEDEITLLNNDIFSILNKEYGFFNQSGAQNHNGFFNQSGAQNHTEDPHNSTEILDSVPDFDVDSFEDLFKQLEQMDNDSGIKEDGEI